MTSPPPSNSGQNRRARDRIVVTGIGAVSAWGWGVEPLREGLRSGTTRIGPFQRFDHTRQRTHIAGEVPGDPPERFALGPAARRLSFADRFALFAALEALEGAGLEPPFDGIMPGVFFGSSTGGMYESELYFEALVNPDAPPPRRSQLASQQLNGPGDAVARRLGVLGPVCSVSSACASGALAIEAALAALRAGEVDLAIAGASDSLCLTTYSGFNALQAVDERACRPFRADRAGMSLGEGAGVLILERADDALGRGAVPLVELMGAGSSCDAHHMTAPHPRGLGAILALRLALDDARLGPDAIDLINTHGTGTPLNDAAEWAAFESVFGVRARDIPLTATKSSVGHLLGASGAIEAVAVILDLLASSAHPAAGDGEADPALAGDLVLGARRHIPGAQVAVSTSLGFGGASAALVIGRWRDGTA